MSLNNGWMKVAEVAVNILVTINLALTGWCLTQVVSIKEDMAAIKGNRFTSSDGLAVWQKIADVQAQLAKLPQDYPPKWFIERVDRMEASMERRFDELDKRWEDHTRSGAHAPRP